MFWLYFNPLVYRFLFFWILTPRSKTPRYSHLNPPSLSKRSFVVSLIWILSPSLILPTTRAMSEVSPKTLLKEIGIRERSIFYPDLSTISVTYRYLGIFGPVTIPIAGPEWMPIRSCKRNFGTREILKIPEAAERSKAIDAISITCLFPIKCLFKDYHLSS